MFYKTYYVAVFLVYNLHSWIQQLILDDRVNFLASTCLVTALYMLHHLCVGSRITVMESHVHTLQQTHMHKTVTERWSQYATLVEGNWSIVTTALECITIRLHLFTTFSSMLLVQSLQVLDKFADKKIDKKLSNQITLHLTKF